SQLHGATKETGAISSFAGRWRYVNAEAVVEKKGVYPVRSCDVGIDPDGRGSLQCQFDGVPASARSDVAFHFQLPTAVPSASVTADWSEGSATGSVTVTRKDNDRLDVTWKVRKNQQEFFIVVLYSPVTLSKIQ